MMKKDETVLPIHEFAWSHLQTCPSQVSCLVCAGSWPPHVVSLQVAQSARALQWIIDTLKSQDFAAKDAPTLSTWILSVYFHIYTMTVSHKHFVSCRYHNRWGLWPNHQHYKERGPAPCERPTVSLPRRQSQTFPRSRGESPVGGISQHHWWRNVFKKNQFEFWYFITQALPSFRWGLTFTSPNTCRAVMTGTAWTGLLLRTHLFPSIFPLI